MCPFSLEISVPLSPNAYGRIEEEAEGSPAVKIRD